jgi:hypothetical protein
MVISNPRDELLVLRREDIELVVERHALRMKEPKRPMSNKERQQYDRIRKRTIETLNTLATLMEKWSESQLEQTFNVKNMRGFFRALFSMESDELRTLLKDMSEQEVNRILYERKAKQDVQENRYKSLQELETKRRIKNVRKMVESRRIRITGLWAVVLSSGATYDYAARLVGRDVMRALNYSQRVDQALRAIYYATTL